MYKKEPIIHHTLLPNDTILSKHIYMSMDTRKTQKNNNVIALGSSLDEIRECFLKPNILQGNVSYVIHDPTGELLKSMREPLEKMGYEIIVLDLNQKDDLLRYNPFAYIRENDDIFLLIDLFYKEHDIYADPFYLKAEQLLFRAIFFYVFIEYKPEERSLAAVYNLLQRNKDNYNCPSISAIQYLNDLFDELRNKDCEHLAVKTFDLFNKVSYKDEEKNSIIVESLRNRLKSYHVPEFKNTLLNENLDFTILGEKPAAFFVIPNKEDSVNDTFLSLFYSQAIDSLMYYAEKHTEKKCLNRYVRFIFDNFKSVAYIPQFINGSFNSLHMYNISCIFSVKSLYDFCDVYDNKFGSNNWEVLVGNCDTLLFYGFDGSAGSLDANYLNLNRVTDYYFDLHYSSIMNHSVDGKPNPVKAKPLFDRNLSSMNSGDCFIFIKGNNTFFDSKYTPGTNPDVYEHIEFQEIDEEMNIIILTII